MSAADDDDAHRARYFQRIDVVRRLARYASYAALDVMARVDRRWQREATMEWRRRRRERTTMAIRHVARVLIRDAVMRRRRRKRQQPSLHVRSAAYHRGCDRARLVDLHVRCDADQPTLLHVMRATRCDAGVETAQYEYDDPQLETVLARALRACARHEAPLLLTAQEASAGRMTCAPPHHRCMMLTYADVRRADALDHCDASLGCCLWSAMWRRHLRRTPPTPLDSESSGDDGYGYYVSGIMDDRGAGVTRYYDIVDHHRRRRRAPVPVEGRLQLRAMIARVRADSRVIQSVERWQRASQ